MPKHVLQSDLWAKFKNSIGTPAVCEGGVLYTVHPIPFTQYSYAYCPRVSPLDINFTDLKNSLEKHNCIAVHFDVPNVILRSPEEENARKIFEPLCVKSPRDEFAKGNFLMDLSPSEDALFSNMHTKQRYNVKYAQKKGVVVRESTEISDFDKFFDLYKETGIRQKYYYRSRNYLMKMWNIFNDENKAKLLIAEYEGKPLASWMLVLYDNVLYYPYGGSTENMKNLQASCLIGWEAIRYGKKIGASLFDMWGASENISDESDSYHGFTNFKAKFGGKHVVYLNSYDYVINESVYKLFNTANNLRWKLLNILR